MTRLVVLEIARLRARRLFVILAGAAVLGAIVAGTVLFLKSSHDVEGATERARREQAAGYQACLDDVRDHGTDFPNGVVPIEVCGEFDPASVTADPRFHMRVFRDVAAGSSAPLVVVALLLGASFLGAEWSHRTIATTLLWEPRRARVLVAKAVALAVVVFLGVAAFQAILAGALAPAAAFRGDFAGIDGAWMRATSGVVARGAAVASVASVIGLAIASLGRNTVAALGVAFAYFAVLEGIVRGLKPGWQRWLFGENAVQFVDGRRSPDIGQFRSVWESGSLLALYALLVLALAVIVFRRRDVA